MLSCNKATSVLESTAPLIDCFGLWFSVLSQLLGFGGKGGVSGVKRILIGDKVETKWERIKCFILQGGTLFLREASPQASTNSECASSSVRGWNFCLPPPRFSVRRRGREGVDRDCSGHQSPFLNTQLINLEE